MEHDSPTLLFNLAHEHLMAAKVIRPGALVLAMMVPPRVRRPLI
ncbi:hypothetical protein HD597_000175 [Nonomuraea thailandensis]|uniref:Uncharacterized protein n=1 Tax=Nonomuraea thailandensis TaxID=1188745 RepID=A0A9X2JYY1_9ACTN|nr:DUF4158 domain-containing protein [Nonomuraea thailandensis]MCP2353155.1 hypothetical protein [Nonomuraea thailandensis]